jgi:bis(5'-nucleosyl)-tetraphosphatase (symmetrical)
VLGNHDLHFLAVASGAFRDAKVNTLEDILQADDCVELFDWVRSCPLVHRETLATAQGNQDFLMVHAGIAPGWSFDQTRARAQEVEQILQGADFIPFLEQMYGDQPDTWHEQLTGIERLRIITNTLTRIRFCTPQGRMNMKIKTGPDKAPADLKPWFDFQQLAPGQQLLFGHWATLDGHTGMTNIQALDTGCVWGRCLTLLRLEDGERIAVSCADV